jgi:hydrogenase/urease accessory protein HupE
MTAGLAAGVAQLCIAPVARGHLVTTGLGPVYDGIGHLLLTPEDLVPATAIALYAGLRGTVAGRRAMFLMPLAWFAGGLLGSAVDIQPAFPITAFSFLVLGGLVAADLWLPCPAVAGLAILFGLLHGFLNGGELQEGAELLGLLGITAMLFVMVALVSALVVSLKRPWTRISVRVAGSWIAATGMLMIGWSVR